MGRAALFHLLAELSVHPLRRVEVLNVCTFAGEHWRVWQQRQLLRKQQSSKPQLQEGLPKRLRLAKQRQRKRLERPAGLTLRLRPRLQCRRAHQLTWTYQLQLELQRLLLLQILRPEARCLSHNVQQALMWMLRTACMAHLWMSRCCLFTCSFPPEYSPFCRCDL